jgi:hypothetical protein
MKKTIMIALAAIVLASCTRIGVGNVGLKIDQTGDSKGVNPTKYVTGWVWYNPIGSDVVEFPTYMQHVEYEAFKINAFGGSQFTIKPYLNFVVDGSRADKIYQEFKTTDLEDISTRYIRNAVYQSFTDVTGKYNPDALLKNREKYEKEVFENLRISLEKKGFIIQQVTSNMVPPDVLIASIDAKNKADQDAQAIQLQVAQSIAQANKDIAEAKGDSASKVIRAAGNARAYELEQRNLTPLLVEKMRIEKWNGVLPVYGQTPQMFKAVQ